MLRSEWITVSLVILLYTVTASASPSEDEASQSRFRRFVSHYQRRLGPKSIVNGLRMYWYCRRGTKLAICHRSDNQAKTARRTAFKASDHRDCFPTKCVNGNCIRNKCRCKSGWAGRRCNIDINECARTRHSCEHLCVNVAGSYRCACRTGYSLQTDGKSCHTSSVRSHSARAKGTLYSNMNLVRRSRLFAKRYRKGLRKPANGSSAFENNLKREVLSRWYLSSRLRQKTCKKSCRYRCVVTNGKEKCLCPRGFTLGSDEKSCIDFNECLDSIKTTCPVNQECKNTYGGFTCKCRVGFIRRHGISGKACIDVDECLTGEHRCDRNAYCVNTVGSYACNCMHGYRMHGAVCRRITPVPAEIGFKQAPSIQLPTPYETWLRGKQVPARRPELE